MTQDQFRRIVAERLAGCEAELFAKNEDYASPENGDFLANFYETAKRLDMDHLKAWAVHFEKHIIAIERYVKVGRLRSEPIHGRIKDAINYLILLDALIHDAENPAIGSAQPRA